MSLPSLSLVPDCLVDSGCRLPSQSASPSYPYRPKLVCDLLRWRRARRRRTQKNGRMDIHRCSTTRKTSPDTEKPGDSGHMSGYSGQPFGHPVLDPDTPSINQDTPDIVFGHSGRWPGDSGFGRYTFKKMFLSGFCGSQGFVQILWSTSSKSKTCRSKSLLIIRGFYTQI